MRITIKDIAELAGVSKTTVSFAFNDPERIGADTRERILAIAEEHGYVPDPVARTMSSKRVGTIGLLVPQSISVTFANRYMSQILSGLGDACEANRYTLTLIPPVEGSLYNSVRNASVDGFVTLGLLPNMDAVRIIQQRQIPFVTIDGSEAHGLPSVCIDDRGAARTLMQHVLSAGHRHVAILSLGHEESSPVWQEKELTGTHYSGISDLRLAGCEDALREVDLSMGMEQVPAEHVGASMEAGWRASAELLRRSPRPTAIVAMCDEVALGAYRAADELGLRIPDDVSIAGFDGIVEGELVKPELTTLVQPGFEKGREAGSMLFSIITGTQAPVPPKVIETSLRLGGSVAAPAVTV